MNYFDYILHCANNNICFICKNKVNIPCHIGMYIIYKCKNCNVEYKGYRHIVFTIGNLHIDINNLTESMTFYYGNRDKFIGEHSILTYYFNFNDKCSKRYIHYPKNITWESEQIDSSIIESYEDLKEFCNLLSKIQVFS